MGVTESQAQAGGSYNLLFRLLRHALWGRNSKDNRQQNSKKQLIKLKLQEVPIQEGKLIRNIFQFGFGISNLFFCTMII